MAFEIDQLDTSALIKQLQPLAQILQDDVKAELLKQDHRATGKLIDSIKVEIKDDGENKISIICFSDGVIYGQYVDRGRRKGVKRIPVQVLIDWVKIKGFESEPKKIESMAWAIQTKTFKEGNRIFREPPQYGNFVNKVLIKDADKIKEIVSQGFNVVIRNFVRSFSVNLNKN